MQVKPVSFSGLFTRRPPAPVRTDAQILADFRALIANPEPGVVITRDERKGTVTIKKGCVSTTYDAKTGRGMSIDEPVWL